MLFILEPLSKNKKIVVDDDFYKIF